jgi:hypothetical protein
MENFNLLFESAAKVADRRNVVYNQLIEKTVSEILPKFCDACKSLDMKRVYLNLNTRPNLYCEKQFNEDGEMYYLICIDIENKTFTDVKIDIQRDEYYVPDAYTWYEFNSQSNDAKWLKCGVVELVKTLNNRLAHYIKTYEQKNSIAENLVNG